MAEWIPKPSYKLAENTITAEDRADLAAWLGTDPWLTQGELVREFERQFAERVGAKHAVFVNSGSSANLLAWFLPIVVNREEVSENRRVVVPSVAWSTSVAPAIQFGYEPVLCEADRDTWGLDPEDLRRICEKAVPSIVLLVHVLGVPCKMTEIRALKDEFGFLLIEDACAAFGSQPVGKHGEITTFSTYYGHQLSTIEGGFVCTNGEDGVELLRMLRAHGWAADCSPAWRERLTSKVDSFREKFTFYLPGFNVRGTDLQAKIGLSQLKRADAVAATRRNNHALYHQRLKGSNQMSVQSYDQLPASIGFGVLAASKDHRNRIAAALAAKGIETRPIGGGNMARQPFWTAHYGESKRGRPIADRVHEHGFQLPNHPGLTPEDVAFISETVLSVGP